MTDPRRQPALSEPYYDAPFGVAFTRFWKKGATFTGRASRSEYWKAYLGTTAVVMALYLVGAWVPLIALSSGDYSSLSALMNAGGAFTTMAFLGALAIFLPVLAVTWRRLHDTNRSGAFFFLAFIPFVGGIILLVLLAQESQPAGAQYDVGGAPRAAYPAIPLADADAGYGQPTPAASSFGAVFPPPVPAPPGSVPVTPPPAPSGLGVVPPVPVHTPSGFASVPPPAPSGFGAVPPPPVPAPPGSVPVPPPTSVVGTLAPAPAAFVLAAAPVPTPESLGAPVPTAFAQAPVDDLDETRLSAGLSAAAWIVELPDGRRIPVGSSLYFGRDPLTPAEEPAAIRVPVDDPNRSMSKTHAKITVNGTDVAIVDLHSTNGTTLTSSSGESTSLTPGFGTHVVGDTDVAFGDYVVHVRRNA